MNPVNSSFLDFAVLGAMLPAALVPSQPLYGRVFDSQEAESLMAVVSRADSAPEIVAQARQRLEQIAMRGITSGMTAFPVRENLEAEAKILIPVETPLRNRLPRVPGAGLAAKWKTITGFGTGFVTSTTTSGTTNSTNTLTVTNANGFYPGETILYNSNTHTITAVNYSTNVISVGASPGITSNSQTNGQAVVINSYFQPGGGAASQMFFSESGSPVEKTTVYADRTASYKLLGEKGSVTVFAMAAGANYQNQLAIEKRNRLYSTMLSEEYALLNGDASSTAVPWGDGSSALAFDGLNTIVKANAPANQVQTSVGALTLAHIDAQLTRIYYQGGRGIYIVVNGQEIISLAKLLEASGSVYRIMIDAESAVIGKRPAYYRHPISGELIPLLVSRMQPAGTMTFGCDYLPDGSAAAEVDVLPQTMLPELAPNDQIQGYTAQEIAPSTSAPQVLPFIVSVFEVLKVKGYPQFAISTGVTPA